MASNEEKSDDTSSNNGSGLIKLEGDEMSELINKETIKLVDKIKKTNAYIDYLNYKSILERQPDIFRQVEEYRRRSFEIQIAHSYGAFNAYENLLNLNNEYEELLCEPIVKSFIEAELKVSKLISGVFDTIAEHVDFDIKFLD